MRVVYFRAGRKAAFASTVRLLALAGAIAIVSFAASPRTSDGSASPPLVMEATRSDDKITLRIGIAAEPTRLDPHDASDAPSSMINFHIYDRLVELNEEMEPTPSLATRWSRNERGDVWTLELRPGVVFHDGTPLDARTVKASFDRLLDPRLGLARRSVISGFVREVVVRDALTVEFRLYEPVAPFLQILAHDALGIVATNGTEPSTPAGTGPFRLGEWIPGTRLVLEAFEAHWRGAPAVDRLVFLSIPTASSRAIMLETGEIDVAFPIEPVHVASVDQSPEVVVETSATQRLVYLALNMNHPPFNEKEARRLASRAIDRASIARHLLFSLANPAWVPIAEGTWGYRAVTTPFDPHSGQSEIERSGSNRPRVSLWSPAGRYPQDRAVAQAVGAFLELAGFDVEIRLFEWGAYLSSLRQSDGWNAAVLGWVPSTGDADMALRPILYSGSRGNISGYASPAFDGVIDEAARELDPDRRLELYGKAVERIIEDVPIVPLYSPHLAFGRRRSVEGVRLFSTETIDFRFAHVTGASM